MKKFLILYLVILNLAAFVLYAVDKRRAKKKLWRIPERTLLLAAFFGGSLGALFSMHLFYHKTLHRRFSIGVPVMFLLHAALFAYLFYVIL